MNLNITNLRLSLLGMLLLTAMYAAGSGNYYAYTIAENSWISISGTTNVNAFVCIANQYSPRGFVMVDDYRQGQQLHFQEALLHLENSSFDCNNRLMNRDLYKALGGDENPGIDIKLIEALTIGPCPVSRKGFIQTKVSITINGVTRMEEIRINFLQEDELPEYHFQGSKKLRMSDFNIDAPSPMMGIIRVSDAITIDFNLIVKASLITQR
jgi:hypothetical protein